jgi:hypothetical protein
MRTTIDIPDALFRQTKSIAAARGLTLKQFIINAVEREAGTESATPKKRRSPFPLIHLKHTKVLDLSNFDFDDLLP